MLFPNNEILDYLWGKATYEEDFCNFVQITDELCNTVEKSIVCNDIEDKMLIEMESES